MAAQYLKRKSGELKFRDPGHYCISVPLGCPTKIEFGADESSLQSDFYAQF